MNKYYIVTTISQFRIRYAIPVEELQKMNTEKTVSKTWAEDEVTCNQVNEFSQEHVGEFIIDSREIDEEELLNIFDKENSYMSGWTTEKKLGQIKDWRCE